MAYDHNANLMRLRTWLSIFRGGLSVSVAATAVGVAAAIFLGDSHPPPLPTVVVLAIITSLVASFLVVGALSVVSNVGAAKRSNLAATLLGLTPGDRINQTVCAIVLPTFRISSELIEFVTSSVDLVEKGFDLDEIGSLREARGVVHSRRDMLLANEIAKILIAYGLPDPIFIKDEDFLSQMWRVRADKKSARLYHVPLSLGGADFSDPSRSIEIEHVISVGIFSNALTKSLSRSGLMPFRISESEVDQRRRSVFFGQGPDNLDNYSLADLNYPESDLGLIARLNAGGWRVVVVGGATGIGTVRMGDFLTWPAQVWDPSFAQWVEGLGPSDTVGCIVRCPGSGRRFGRYSVSATMRSDPPKVKTMTLVSKLFDGRATETASYS